MTNEELATFVADIEAKAKVVSDLEDKQKHVLVATWEFIGAARRLQNVCAEHAEADAKLRAARMELKTAIEKITAGVLL